MYTLCTGSDRKGLTVAGRAEKELPKSEVAKGGILFLPAFPSPHPLLESLFTGKNVERACLLFSVIPSKTTTTWKKEHTEKKSDNPNHQSQ